MAENPDDKKEELIPVGPGADAPPEAERDERTAGEDYAYDDEERVGRGGEPEDDDNPADDGRPRTPAAKRRERKRRARENTVRENELLRQENAQLRQAAEDHSRRLSAVESRQTHSDVAAVDARIAQTDSDLRQAEDLLRQALEKGDNASVVEALRIRDEFRDGLNQLRWAKQSATQERRQTPQQQQRAQVDPVIAARSTEWQRNHEWFDPSGRDPDSRYALVEERALAAEGRLNPRTDAYWDELDRRLAKRMPEHYEISGPGDDEDEDEEDLRTRQPVRRPVNGNGGRRPTGPTMRVGGRERVLRKGEVFVDQARRKALEDNGLWDDEGRRNRILKYYQAHDRANSDASRRRS